MAIRTLSQLVVYADAKFPKWFARLPPVSSFTIKDGPYLLMGKSLTSDDRPSNEVYYFPRSYSPGECYSRYIDSDGCFVSFSRKGAMVQIPCNKICLSEPFSWIQMSSRQPEFRSRLDAFARYCLEASGYEGYIEEARYDLSVLFGRACRDIVTGLDRKKQNQGGDSEDETVLSDVDMNDSIAGGLDRECQNQDGDSEDETMSSDADTSDSIYKQKLDEFTSSITQSLAAELKAFEESSTVEHERLQNENRRLKAKVRNLEKSKKRLQGACDRKSDLLDAAREVAEWKQKFKDLRTNMQRLVGDMAN